MSESSKVVTSLNRVLAHVYTVSPNSPVTTLVVVSKTWPAEDIREAYDAEQRHCGENYVYLLQRWEILDNY